MGIITYTHHKNSAQILYPYHFEKSKNSKKKIKIWSKYLAFFFWSKFVLVPAWGEMRKMKIWRILLEKILNVVAARLLLDGFVSHLVADITAKLAENVAQMKSDNI